MPENSLSSKRHPIQLMLRYSDLIMQVDTIQEHKNIIEKLGYVWFGKFGQGVSRDIIAKLNRQCEESVDTRLYLVSKKTITHQATIKAVDGGHKYSIRQKDTKAVPSYYRTSLCPLWIKVDVIEEIQHCNIIKELLLYNSTLPARPDLNSSRALIYVKRIPVALQKQLTYADSVLPPLEELDDESTDLDLDFDPPDD